MRSWTSPAAGAIAVALLAGAAIASIPPRDWQPTVWSGPGKACGTGFAVDLRQSETLTKGYPSVGRIAFTLKAPAGRVQIVEFWSSSPPQIGPEFEDRPGGKLYPLPEPSGIAGETQGEYLFQPDREGALPVTVHFKTPDGGAPAWSPRAYDEVLKRIAFGLPDRAGCKMPTVASITTN